MKKTINIKCANEKNYKDLVHQLSFKGYKQIGKGLFENKEHYIRARIK